MFLLLLASSLCRAQLGGCTDGITCNQVKANGLTFDCRWAGPKNGTQVMLLHGFPEWSSMWMPLMRGLAAKNYRSVACNQRGYSPGARPDDISQYNYDILMSDVWAIADAISFSNFHLIAHDHGAVLGWCVAASTRGSSDLLSYTALSIPHIDAFSAGLFGPGASKAQQMTSTYFTVFKQPNVASMDMNMLYNTLGRASFGDGKSESWSNATEFQKAVWWYPGVFAAGLLSYPPYFTAPELTYNGYLAMAAMRTAFGGISLGSGNSISGGYTAPNPVGKVSLPSLYVCGSKDPEILCDLPYALKTKDYVTGKYTQLTVDCGHELMNCGWGQSGCTAFTPQAAANAETKVVNAIYNHLDAVTSQFLKRAKTE